MNKHIRKFLCATGIWKAHEHKCGAYTVKFFLSDRSAESVAEDCQTAAKTGAATSKIMIGDCAGETGKNAQLSIVSDPTQNLTGLNMKDRVKQVLLMGQFKKYGADVTVFSDMLFVRARKIGVYGGFDGDIFYRDNNDGEIKTGHYALFVLDKNTFIQIGSNDITLSIDILDTITITPL